MFSHKFLFFRFLCKALLVLVLSFLVIFSCFGTGYSFWLKNVNILVNIHLFGDSRKWQPKSTPLDRTWFTTPISRTWKIVWPSLRLSVKHERRYWRQNWSSDINEAAPFSELSYSTPLLCGKLRQLLALWNENGVIHARNGVKVVIS